MESHSSLAPLIDQPKGHYNMLENWCLESIKIVAMVHGLVKAAPSAGVVVKPVLLDRCVNKYPGIAASWN